MRKPVLGHPWRRLLPLAALLLAGAIGLGLLQRANRSPVFEEQVRAAQRMAKAYGVLSSHLRTLGFEPDRESDPNETGIIGVQFSEITTTVGYLPAKRTSANPDFAAYLVRLVSKHATPGNGPVVIALSGSFPALGLAAIIACEELTDEIVVLSSVGASSFGANRPELTWLDMEQVFAEASVIVTRTYLGSLGAGGDIGQFPFEEGRDLALAALERAGVHALIKDSAQDQLAAKVALLERLGPQMLINIGGNEAHVGRSGHLLPPGLVTSSPADPDELGVTGWFLAHQLPVVHLLRIEELALRHGIAIDPVPLPPAGRSAVYYEHVLPLWPLVLLLALVAAYVVGLGLLRRREIGTAQRNQR